MHTWTGPRAAPWPTSCGSSSSAGFGQGEVAPVTWEVLLEAEPASADGPIATSAESLPAGMDKAASSATGGIRALGEESILNPVAGRTRPLHSLGAHGVVHR
jgi:hypothetical protein